MTTKTVLLDSLRTRLLPEEAVIAAVADRDVYTAMFLESLELDPAELPETLPRSQPDASVSLLPRVALPAEFEGDFKQLSQEMRGQLLRSALHRLAGHWNAGRYLTADVPFMGTEVYTPRMSTGGPLSVQRAAWRTRAGDARAATRPGQVLTASERDMPSVGEPLNLWEVYQGEELLRVVAAETIYAAAQGSEVRAYRPDILMRREALRGGKEAHTDYLI